MTSIESIRLDEAKDQPGLNELRFKTRSLIRNDWYLSIIHFFLVLIIPFLIWEKVVRSFTSAWLLIMTGIIVGRWFCAYMYNQIDSTIDQKEGIEKLSSHNLHNRWSRAIISLSLLSGLSWGIAGVLFFQSDSLLHLSLTALILISLGAAGAVSYSSKPLIAITFLLSVVLPFTIQLYINGGDTEFILASFLSVFGLLFCFITDRIHQTLTIALEVVNHDEEEILVLEEHRDNLHSLLESEKRRRKNLELVCDGKNADLSELKDTLSSLDKELYIHSNNLKDLTQRIKAIDLSNAASDHQQIISSIKEEAEKLSSSFPPSDNELQVPHNEPVLSLPDLNKRQNTVLLVDDDLKERQRIETYLHTLGLKFESTHNVPEALSILCTWADREKHFDLIIANRWMPDMDGVSLAKCLNDDPEFNSLPFALINSGATLSEETLKKTGIRMVIEKPVLPEHINDLISRLIHGLQDEPVQQQINTEVTDSIQISLSEGVSNNITVAPSVIDQYVIDGLRASTPENFSQIVSDFLEDIPQLVIDAQTAYGQSDEDAILHVIRELGSRSLHMGAERLVMQAKKIEKMIAEEGLKKIYGQLRCIEAEFIQVESLLLSNLSNYTFLAERSKH